MRTLVATIRPLSAFSGAIRGDTLFGQLCWALRHREGEERLVEQLRGYIDGHPFAVASDAFPSGHIPRPALPLHRYRETGDKDKKRAKRLCWVPVDSFRHPLVDWLKYALEDDKVIGDEETCYSSTTRPWTQSSQPHNSINRLSGTTGSGEFAPYVMSRTWQHPELLLDIYLAYDEARLSADTLVGLLGDVGASGYGRDASIGLGKFDVITVHEGSWPSQEGANAWLTLAPCAPQGLGFDPAQSWYQPFTRFGRHGDMAVHSGRPFKTPVLLADTGALLTPSNLVAASFVGQGVGGDGSLSRAPGFENTVQQGYAPVLPVQMEAAS